MLEQVKRKNICFCCFLCSLLNAQFLIELVFGAQWIPEEVNRTGSFEVLQLSNGDVYNGPLTEDGIPNGYGEYVFGNGDTYNGNFVNGVMSGRGLLKFSNGDTYEGDFSVKYHSLKNLNNIYFLFFKKGK